MTMRKGRTCASFVGLWLSAALVFPGSPKNQSEPGLKIVTTVFPLKEFASAVSGELGRVDLLLPSGAEIHSWQPRPSDLVKLARADLFVHVGAGLEPWVSDILRSVDNPDLLVVEAGKGLSLVGDEAERHGDVSSHGNRPGGPDPHVWLDFANDLKIIDRLAESLSILVPGKKDRFAANAAGYKQKLTALDARYRETLHRCDHKTIVLGGHAAFGYMARRYGLSQISLYGLSPDSRPTPRQLIEVIEFIKTNGIPAIFFEANISRELSRVIAEETGAKTLVLNPGVSLPRKGKEAGLTFLNIM